MKFLKDIDFKNKRVLLRVDYNVPLKNGVVQDDSRIKLTLPTIKHVLSQSKTKLVIISHLGRPGGKIDANYSLEPVARELEALLGKKITFIKEIFTEGYDNIVRNLKDGEIALAENLRFCPQEESNDEKFAIHLCHHSGVFINEAFAASHRAHASIAQIPRFKPSCAGYLMQKEIEELSKALNPPKRPAIAIIGGAKIETKLPLIENLAKKYDAILVGGKIAVEAHEKKMEFSQNVVIANDFSEGNLDIGSETISKYEMAISAASFIVWNGPMGKYEEEKSSRGTNAIYEAIKSADAYKIAGGGETLDCIRNNSGEENFDFISSGGGAMLEFLSGIKLPGLEALEKSK